MSSWKLNTTTNSRRAGFTFDDDKKILEFLEYHYETMSIKGEKIYKLMESENIIAGRSFHSLKNRVTRTIIRVLDKHKVSLGLRAAIIDSNKIPGLTKNDMSMVSSRNVPSKPKQLKKDKEIPKVVENGENKENHLVNPDFSPQFATLDFSASEDALLINTEDEIAAASTQNLNIPVDKMSEPQNCFKNDELNLPPFLVNKMKNSPQLTPAKILNRLYYSSEDWSFATKAKKSKKHDKVKLWNDKDDDQLLKLISTCKTDFRGKYTLEQIRKRINFLIRTHL